MEQMIPSALSNPTAHPVGGQSEIRLQKEGTDLKSVPIKEAAQSFESYFVYLLLQEMRKTVGESGLLGRESGQKAYQSMFDEAIAGAVSKTGGMGLARALMEQYKKQK